MCIRDRGDELHQVVLYDVAQHPGAIIVPPTMADALALRHGDLYMIDIVAIPHRLKDRVGKAQHQEVLHLSLIHI